MDSKNHLWIIAIVGIVGIVAMSIIFMTTKASITGQPVSSTCQYQWQCQNPGFAQLIRWCGGNNFPVIASHSCNYGYTCVNSAWSSSRPSLTGVCISSSTSSSNPPTQGAGAPTSTGQTLTILYKGDLNDDKKLTNSDIQLLMQRVTQNGNPSCITDTNGDGVLNMLDVQKLVHTITTGRVLGNCYEYH